jgi:hypothetical protein
VIFFITTNKHTYTIQTFLDEWAPEMADFIKIITYDDLLKQTRFQKGAYFFTDIERLPTHIRFLSEKIWEKLSECQVNQLFNRPEKSMRRYELLTTLYSRGINEFQIRRLNDDFSHIKYPVFIRGENDHTGNLSDILNNKSELQAALKEIIDQGNRINELLVVEYLDVSDKSSNFIKYSAFVFGNKVIPRHIAYSKDWMVKYPSYIDKDILEKEQVFMAENPHEEELRQIFKLANIEYGRIDYSLLDGKVQVWEINTNPMIVRRKSEYLEGHIENQLTYINFVKDVLHIIENKHQENDEIEILLDDESFKKADQIKRKERLSRNISQAALKLIKPFYINSILKN